MTDLPELPELPEFPGTPTTVAQPDGTHATATGPGAVPPPSVPTPVVGVLQALRNDLSAQVNRLVVGQQRTIDALLVAASVGGHVLLEGPPGVAKTLLARIWAQALGVTFRRVQFTPDMLPSDLTGTVALRQGSDGALVFRPGPIFASVVLADEINRTPPKTQAALLEAMQEQQVTVDGTSHQLPIPFLVVATQNPIEYEGTYPLPEAQLDRFLMQIEIGYPEADDEIALLKLGHHGTSPLGLDDVRAVASVERLVAARVEVDATRVYDEVLGYISALVRATRTLPSVLLGASPRAGVHLLAASKAVARLNGRDFVTPDDVAALASPVLKHRLVLRSEATLDRYRPADAIATVLATVPVPR